MKNIYLVVVVFVTLPELRICTSSPELYLLSDFCDTLAPTLCEIRVLQWRQVLIAAITTRQVLSFISFLV
ncbi:MAG: hypothetical protein WCP14_01995 [bacterium]